MTMNLLTVSKLKLEHSVSHALSFQISYDFFGLVVDEFCKEIQLNLKLYKHFHNV